MIEEKRIQQEIDLQTYLNNLILDDKQRSGVTGLGVTGSGDQGHGVRGQSQGFRGRAQEVLG